MFPRITPYSSSARDGLGGFSFGLYLKHREYNALIGAVAMIVVLIAKMLLFR